MRSKATHTHACTHPSPPRRLQASQTAPPRPTSPRCQSISHWQTGACTRMPRGRAQQHVRLGCGQHAHMLLAADGTPREVESPRRRPKCCPAALAGLMGAVHPTCACRNDNVVFYEKQLNASQLAEAQAFVPNSGGSSGLSSGAIAGIAVGEPWEHVGLWVCARALPAVLLPLGHGALAGQRLGRTAARADCHAASRRSSSNANVRSVPPTCRGCRRRGAGRSRAAAGTAPLRAQLADARR